MEDGSPDSEVIFEEDVWEIDDEDGERPPEDGSYCRPELVDVAVFCRFAGGDGRHGV